MFKIEKEYNENYGHIKDNYDDRLNCLLSEIKLKNKDVYSEIKRVNSIGWSKLSLIIYLIPKGTPRPRCGNRGVFYVKGADINRKIFKKFASENDITLITTPTKFYCTSYFPIPKTMSPVEKILAELGFIRPISKPDWDNIAKGYCDMIQSDLLYDDCLVIEGVSKKFYSIKPRIEITLEYMNEHDCKFNEKKYKRKEYL